MRRVNVGMGRDFVSNDNRVTDPAGTLDSHPSQTAAKDGAPTAVLMPRDQKPAPMRPRSALDHETSVSP